MAKWQCPHCGGKRLREFGAVENISTIISFGTSFFTSSPFKKIQEVVDMASAGEFPNYVCKSCDRKIMVCGKCGEGIPYQHTGAQCPSCGYR